MRALVSAGWVSVAAGPWMLASGLAGRFAEGARRSGALGALRAAALLALGAWLVHWSLTQTASGEVGYLSRTASVVPAGWAPALRWVSLASGLVGWAGLLALAGRLADRAARRERTPPWLLALIGGYALGIAFYNNVTYYFYDRYLLPYLPLVFALSVALFPVGDRGEVRAAAEPQRRPSGAAATLAAVGVTALFLSFGVADTWANFRGQETLWREAAALEARGVPVHQMDAREYSFTRLWHWWRDHREAERAVDMRCDGWLVAVALPVIDRRYALGYGPMEGYRAVKEAHYPLWGTAGQGTVLVQERVTDLCADTRRQYAGP